MWGGVQWDGFLVINGEMVSNLDKGGESYVRQMRDHI